MPGDVLWLPSYYWHHVSQLDTGAPNLSLNCWVGTTKQRVALGQTVLLGALLGGRAAQMERAHALAHRARGAPDVDVTAILASLRASRQRAGKAAGVDDGSRRGRPG